MTELAFERTLLVPDADAMIALGRALGGVLRAGDLVALDGPLGAGKTTLTRGIGEALGARGAVTSPTFVLARTHPTETGCPLVHIDAYRLGSPMELDDLDIPYEESITVVEWAEGMIDGISEAWIEIEIDRGRRDDARQVRIRAYGQRWGGGALAELGQAIE